MEEIVYEKGFTACGLPDEIKKKIDGVSYHENHDVGLDELAYLKMQYVDFNGQTQTGEMIVHQSLAREVLEIFSELYRAGYQIEKMRLVDEYDADDERSMADNNSSAFNYRVVADTDMISMHGYGRAIDINPLINPYIVGEKIMPANGAEYADRSKKFAHKIDHDDLCYKLFKERGWTWGGDWKTQKDYQHFYKT
ncbi:MAG: M15 family metallopeptidase [Ruminococcus sp.]|nr:M15 family metallopeptidase [Ruminococcus sp.]